MAWLQCNTQFKSNMDAWQVTLKVKLEKQRAVLRAVQWEEDFPTLS